MHTAVIAIRPDVPLAGVLLVEADVKGVEIGPGVTEIGASAFSDCKGLTSVTIPDGVADIGDLAFSGCSVLAGVEIPNSVTNTASGRSTNVRR